MRVVTRESYPWLLLLLCLVAMEARAALTARLDSDRIAEGETVQLLIETAGQVSGSPDTQPLEQDFDLLGINSGTRVNIANGQIDSRTTWTLTLSPKRDGRLSIPPLELAGEYTPELTLEVTKASVVDSSDGVNPIFIETEVDRTTPYVQSMVRYTVRLFHALRLYEGKLSDPQPENALVRRLGEDRESFLVRGGRRYRVVERQYAIFPQASGELVLPGPVLDARIADQRKSSRTNPSKGIFGSDFPFDDSFFNRSPFRDRLNATRPVRVRGEAQSLDVLPRPEQLDSPYWLPAQGLEMTEDWQPEHGPIQVGTPVTRALTISAQGVTGQQLPDLEPAPVDGFKIYPDRSRAKTRDLDQGVEGVKSRSIAFVPTRPGSFTLPPVRLHWWDTRNDRQQLAELPARTIEVVPAPRKEAGSEQRIAAAGVVEPTGAQPAGGQSPAEVPSPKIDPAGSGFAAVSGPWPWISALFALLWLATLALWWRQGNAGSVPEPKAAHINRPDARAAQRRFQSACRSGDPGQARRTLLEWARAHWFEDPPGGFDDLTARLDDPRARDALQELDRWLYRKPVGDWDGGSLLKAIPNLPERHIRGAVRQPLPDLYR